jgi:group I intron endonuclease
LGWYYDKNCLSNAGKNMPICRAILKYGHSRFILEIIVHCEKKDTLQKEQYFFYLKPEYNILSQAGSSFGYRHREDSLEKMRKPLNPEHLAKIREILAKRNASAEHLAMIREHISKINAERKICVVVTNLKTGESVKYESIRAAARELNMNHVRISRYIKSKAVFQGLYSITVKES